MMEEKKETLSCLANPQKMSVYHYVPMTFGENVFLRCSDCRIIYHRQHGSADLL